MRAELHPRHRSAAATAQHRFDLAFACSPIGAALLDADGVVLRGNAPLRALCGREPVGLHFEDLIADGSRGEEIAQLASGELSAATIDCRLRGTAGSSIPVRLSVGLLRDEEGAPREYVVHVQDTSEHEQLRERVRFEAEHDPLTGVLNRRTFARVLSHHVSYARRYRRQGALLLIEVGALRAVNGAAGHAVGDAVLQAVGRCLTARLRETDVVGRVGGDEFAIVLAEADSGGARRVAADLLRTAGGAAAAALPPRAGDIRVAAVAAIVPFAAGPATAEELLTRADSALLEAKERGNGTVVLIEPETGGGRRLSRRTWAEKLRASLEADAFLLDAQPIVDLATGEPVQYELLLRMRDDDGAIVRPSAFLHVAERCGLMRAIDEWVVRRAVALARARLEAGAPVTLAVNVSGESVGDPAFLPLVVEELIDHPDVGAQLVFEITERTAVADLDQARRLMERLGDFGCRFALDDFGTGVGSFAYLKHLPVDYLKLDGEFTRTLPENPADQEIVSAVVQAARGLGKQTVAECIEDEKILEAVRDFRVELGQGIHVARPGRASELLGL